MRVQQYFDATVPTWEDIYRQRTLYATIYRQRLWTALRLVDQLGLARPGAALDLGCGPGFGTTALARRGFRVCAADSTAQMVELTLARARSAGLHARVSGRVSDIRALSFPDAQFDLVLVIGVSEWLDSLLGPLAEVARVLKPGGCLVLSADNSGALCSLLDPLRHPLVVPIKRALGAARRRLWPRPRPLRTRAYSRRTLDRALRRAGLTITDGVTIGFGPFTFCTRGLLPDHLGHALDRQLQALAQHLPPLRSAGLVHVVSAVKPALATPLAS